MSEEIFSGREGHLISLAAAVAAGCLPCAGYYIERGRERGVADEELRAAIAVAESVRTRAAEDSGVRARGRLGDETGEPPVLAAPQSELDLLLSIAAAYAVNSHAFTSQLFDSARRSHVSPDRVLETIQIARGVRNMAIAIVDRRVQREGGTDDGGIDQNVSCICG